MHHVKGKIGRGGGVGRESKRYGGAEYSTRRLNSGGGILIDQLDGQLCEKGRAANEGGTVTLALE